MEDSQIADMLRWRCSEIASGQFQSSLRDLSSPNLHPGLRPGLSSAVPPGLCANSAVERDGFTRSRNTPKSETNPSAPRPQRHQPWPTDAFTFPSAAFPAADPPTRMASDSADGELHVWKNSLAFSTRGCFASCSCVRTAGCRYRDRAQRRHEDPRRCHPQGRRLSARG